MNLSSMLGSSPARRRCCLAAAATVALLTLLDVTARSATAIPLLDGLGGTLGYGANCMPPNDDGSWPADTVGLDITPSFPSGLDFYSGTFTRAWINNNGNISFEGSISTYTPNAFPGAPHPMIAPYWADVDTRNATECENGDYPSGGGYPAGATCMNPATDGVWWSLRRGQMVVTWNHVGYYACHDNLVMNFQAILTAANPGGVGDFDVEYRYNECQWTTGDASGGTNGLGGTPAGAGFDSGDDVHFYTIPGSLTSAVLNLCHTSNVGTPGVWDFSIRNGQVLCPGMGTPCNTGLLGVCAAGTTTCMGTTPVCTQNVQPSPEVCNGLDDDCNGIVDDLGPRACYDGPAGTRSVGICHDGTQICSDAMWGTCTGEVLPRAEVCNGLDNNCDGRIGDGLGTTSCGEGNCRRTVQNCLDGHEQVCMPGEPDGSAGCTPQPDAGGDDDATAPLDATCENYHCSPELQLQGRAGPIGCHCRVGTPARLPNEGVVSAMALALAAIATRRRRRAATVRDQG